MIRVLVTGSRNWPTRNAVWAALDEQHTRLGDDMLLVVGDCPTGADRHAREWAYERGVVADVHLADWAAYGRAAGPRRNAAMVATGPAIVLAFPLGASRGTRGCMRLAERAGIPVKAYAL